MSLNEHPEIIESFEKLGLSPNEAKVYMALLENHPNTGYQLSKISGILRPVVYEMLGRLVEKGGARIVKSNPDTYIPVEIEEFLKNIESDFTDAKKNISLTLNASTVTDKTDFFWNIQGRKNIINAIQTMIESAQAAIYLSINSQEYFDELKNCLIKKMEQNVHIDIFSHYGLDTHGLTLYSYNLDTKTALDSFPVEHITLVYDDYQAIIANVSDNKTGKAAQSTNNILIENVRQGILNKIYLIRLWKLLGTDKIKIMMTHEDRKSLELVERLTRQPH